MNEQRTAIDAQQRRRLLLGFSLAILAKSGMLLLLGRLAATAPQVTTPRQEFEPGTGWWAQWVRWDANWYLHIAREGYGFTSGNQSAVAFWPTYPLLVRALSTLTNDEYDAQLIITAVAGAAAMIGIVWWARSHLGHRAAVFTAGVLLVYPYSWYLHLSGYGDAVFCLGAVAAFLLIDRDRVFAASLVTAVAAAGRPVGFALVIGIVVARAERVGVLEAFGPAPVGAGRPRRIAAWLRIPRAVRPSRIRPVDGWLLVSVAGIAAYVTYLWRTTGDPMAFAAAQEAWGHVAGPHAWFKVDLYHLLRGNGLTLLNAGLVVHGLLAMAAILSIPWVIRRFGWGLGLYCLFLVAVPTVTSKDFQGLGRYLLPAFPMLALLGDRLARSPRWVAAAVMTASCGLLVFWAYWHARGAYVG